MDAKMIHGSLIARRDILFDGIRGSAHERGVNMLLRQDLKRQRMGFTLMEMLIVVAIIVALAGIGGYYLFGALGGAQEDIARSQASGALTNACQTYKLKHQDWPPNLQALLQKDALGGPYLESADALKDPWGGTYQYDPAGPKNNGMKPDIWASPKTGPNAGKMFGNWPSTAQ